MMKLTFLGTSDWIPTAKRNHTAILLSYDGENILVDCGEGTQRQFRKAGISPTKVTKLLITHWHGDHVLGIPGLLQSLALQGYRKTLYIYGPKGTKRFMKEIQKVFVYQEHRVAIKVEEVSGKFFETKDFYLEAKPMKHGTPCNAYSFVKKGQVRIDKNKLRKYRIPSGPLLSRLKHGDSIIYKGKKYFAKDLTYKQGENKVSFVFDTALNKDIAPFVKNSDLLISESSFSDELKAKAREYKHLTAKQAAEIAKKSNTKKLILTHISQRYEKDPSIILNEAKKVFKNSVLVNDLDVISL
jgi:ribonuclease Z